MPDAIGMFDYAYRYTVTNGRDWVYADLDGIQNGYSAAQAGSLSVLASADTTAPAVPTGLAVISASPAGIELTWDAIAGDATSTATRSSAGTPGGPYAAIASTSSTTYTDTSVTEGQTFFYVVRAVDTSFNRSGPSAEVEATAELRTVTLTFNVTVPATTDATGRSVYIAGFLNRLDGNLPEWNPGGVVLTASTRRTGRSRSPAGKESSSSTIHARRLGARREGRVCGEVGNRLLTLSYGASGAQVVNDAVPNWRNVAPCGN